jgi:hypothetical protein
MKVDDDRRSPLARRQRRLLLVTSACSVVATAGLFASLVIQSPQQAAAESEPPPPSVITASVERRVLRDTVVLRGTVLPQRTLDVTPAPGSGGQAILTGVRVSVGDGVAAGHVVLEVSGRPLVVLLGEIPAYRDLRPGAEGQDVAQLQSALRELGYPANDKIGFFGEATKAAVAKFYADRGYAAPTTGDEDARAVESAAESVRKAERAVVDAARAHAEARNVAAGPSPPPDAGDLVIDARTAEERANEDLALARADLAALRRRTGVMMPLAEFAFVPASPVRVDKISVAVGGHVIAPLVTLSGGPPSIHARLSPVQHELVRVGMAVEVTADLLGLRAKGSIASIGELAGDESSGRGYPVVITPEATLDSRLVGEDVRLAVERASTEEEVLVVPISAITATADGRTVVVRISADGREVRVPVTPGASGEGFVAVTVTEGHLDSGDRVVVGR